MWGWHRDWDKTYFTDELRKRVLPLARGQRVTFRYRCKPGGRTKKVKGEFVYLSHKPGIGFRIHLRKVRWEGHYFRFIMIFPCDRIVWTRHYDFIPLLEAPRNQNLLSAPKEK